MIETVVRRRGLFSLAATTLIGASISGCSLRPSVASQGWSKVLVSEAYIPVRSDWQHSVAPDQVSLFSDMWMESAGSPYRLIVGSPTSVSDPQATGAEVNAALRSVLSGYSVTTQEQVMERDSATIRFCDFEAEPEFAKQGRFWIVHNKASSVCAALMAANMNEEYQTVITEGLSLLESDAPAVPDGWARVGRDNITLAVPRDWGVNGAPSHSKRWKESWADADLDGSTRSRLLLASNLGKTKIVDALAQIESDSIAGALKGYNRRSAPVVAKVRQDKVSGTRVDFICGTSKSQGSLWVFEASGVTSAVLLTFADKSNADTVAVVEKSIWFNNIG